MILAVDSGNTRIKWGLHEGGVWRAQGVLPLAQAERLAQVVSQAPARIVLVNVAGAEVEARITGALTRFAAPLLCVTSAAEGCGVVNGYEQPHQLGADRWAALIGARALQSGRCLVVTAGTATTIDRLSAEGVFEGGVILPGFELMRASLARGTAGLPLVEGAYSDSPRSTADAITSGCLSAQLGAIERLYARAGGGTCLLSGGAADRLAAHLAIPFRRIENLVLEGLVQIAARNA